MFRSVAPLRPAWRARPVLATTTLLVGLTALGGAAAGPAQAASLGLDQRCYVAGEQASISGSGFSARAPVTLTRGTDQVGSAVADNSGAVRSTMLVPEVAFGMVESQVEVMASDGTTSARALLNIATVGATYTPADGDPRTLRVSHVISGFGLAEVKPAIYLHYVSPAAQKAPAVTKTTKSAGGTNTTNSLPPDPPGVKSVRLGQLRGPCGVLRTSPRRLFPFKITTGDWLLQYDTSPRYVKGTSSSSFLWVARKVSIK